MKVWDECGPRRAGFRIWHFSGNSAGRILISTTLCSSSRCTSMMFYWQWCHPAVTTFIWEFTKTALCVQRSGALTPQTQCCRVALLETLLDVRCQSADLFFLSDCFLLSLRSFPCQDCPWHSFSQSPRPGLSLVPDQKEIPVMISDWD